jgi:hypothetical protein
MTNGSATSRCRDQQTQARSRAGRIRELLAGGTDMPTIAAGVEPSPRRVPDVAAGDPAGRHRAPEETAR